MSDRREQLIEILRTRGLERRREPFRLTSGALSHDYFDGKRALADGADLELAAQVIVDTLDERGLWPVDAVGGLTMGADHVAHALAVVGKTRWFSVRKQAKNHGKKQAVEGATIGAGTRVLLVDDVVTFGGSIQQAFHAVADTGATIVAAVCLVDRGKVGRAFFADQGVAYLPLATYSDLGIDPVS